MTESVEVDGASAGTPGGAVAEGDAASRVVLGGDGNQTRPGSGRGQ
ncbi:hypothetical protein AB0D24_39660 [Streptomyces javensis]